MVGAVLVWLALAACPGAEACWGGGYDLETPHPRKQTPNPLVTKTKIRKDRTPEPENLPNPIGGWSVEPPFKDALEVWQDIAQDESAKTWGGLGGVAANKSIIKDLFHFGNDFGPAPGYMDWADYKGPFEKIFGINGTFKQQYFPKGNSSVGIEGPGFGPNIIFDMGVPGFGPGPWPVNWQVDGAGYSGGPPPPWAYVPYLPRDKPALCFERPFIGYQCNKKMPLPRIKVWGYNMYARPHGPECRQYEYEGCNGTSNLFYSKKQCQETCEAPTTSDCEPEMDMMLEDVVGVPPELLP